MDCSQYGEMHDICLFYLSDYFRLCHLCTRENCTLQKLKQIRTEMQMQLFISSISENFGSQLKCF